MLVSVTSISLNSVFHSAIVGNVVLKNLKQVNLILFYFTLLTLSYTITWIDFFITKKIYLAMDLLNRIFTSRTLLLCFTDICLKINVPVKWQGKEEQSKWRKGYKIKQWRRELNLKKWIKMNCWGLWKGQTRPFCSLAEGRLLVLLQRSVWLPYGKQRRTKGQRENEKWRKKHESSWGDRLSHKCDSASLNEWKGKEAVTVLFVQNAVAQNLDSLIRNQFHH